MEQDERPPGRDRDGHPMEYTYLGKMYHATPSRTPAIWFKAVAPDKGTWDRGIYTPPEVKRCGACNDPWPCAMAATCASHRAMGNSPTRAELAEVKAYR